MGFGESGGTNGVERAADATDKSLFEKQINDDRNRKDEPENAGQYRHLRRSTCPRLRGFAQRLLDRLDDCGAVISIKQKSSCFRLRAVYNDLEERDVYRGFENSS